MKVLDYYLTSLSDYFNEGIWQFQLDKLPFGKRMWIKTLRILGKSIFGYQDDKCQLKSSALTFYSLLSMVPVMALILGLAKGLGFYKNLEEQLTSALEGKEEVLKYVLEFANSMLEKTQVGVIAGIGIGMLLWSVMKVLGHIESSFNDIWHIKLQRSIARKLTDYLAIMLISPLLIIAASSVTVFISTYIGDATTKVEWLGYLGPFLRFLIHLLPYCLIWIMFTFLYMIMPNTKVNISSALIGGIIAGTIYQVVEAGYINGQVLISKTNAIYGSFAALPLLLIWMNLAWMIILFGAEISFAHQNVRKYEFDSDFTKLSIRNKELIELLIIHFIIQNFAEGKSAATVQEISSHLTLPIRLVEKLLKESVQLGILTETRSDDEKEFGFQPALDINKLSITKVRNMLQHTDAELPSYSHSTGMATLMTLLKEFDELLVTSKTNILLKDLQTHEK